MVNRESLISGGEPLEIERKFLIRIPEISFLKESGCGVIQIEQDYLPNIDNKIRRVRKSTFENGEVKYFYTEKFRLSDTTRIEREKEISEKEYAELYKERAEGSYTIRKTRYLLTDGDFTYEIDLYPEWSDWALVEVELPTETTAVKILPWMRQIREVTGDKRFRNEYIAFHGFGKEAEI